MLSSDVCIGDRRSRDADHRRQSFGFKHGLPLDVDMVIDCRFLPNPALGSTSCGRYSGKDPEVQDYVLDRDVTERFLDRLRPLLDELLPAYAEEGKSYLTMAFGCTGGRHRSVAVAETVAEQLKELAGVGVPPSIDRSIASTSTD